MRVLDRGRLYVAMRVLDRSRLYVAMRVLDRSRLYVAMRVLDRSRLYVAMRSLTEADYMLVMWVLYRGRRALGGDNAFFFPSLKEALSQVVPSTAMHKACCIHVSAL
jgi:hypothetical protein